MRRRTVLVDADILAYQACFADELSIDWNGEGNSQVWAEKSHVETHLTGAIDRIVHATKATDLILCISDKDNWRKDLCPTYKQNRAGTRKPVLLKYSFMFMREHYPWVTYPRLEGDDVMGLLATDPERDGVHILATIDKDLRTIPGRFYNFKTKQKLKYTEQEAFYHHMYQTLVGDAVDGYPGLPGVGPVGARKLLSGMLVEDLWDLVVEAYSKRGLTEEDALLQARLAYILRHGDYNFETKEVRLWEPPKR